MLGIKCQIKIPSISLIRVKKKGIKLPTFSKNTVLLKKNGALIAAYVGLEIMELFKREVVLMDWNGMEDTVINMKCF